MTHANGSVVVSYFKGDDVHTRVKTGGGGLAFQEFASNTTVSFNASSPTYRAFVDRWGSSFHGMLDADTFRQVVANDFRILALISLVAGSWLVISAFSGIPYLFAGLSWDDALFESMSGFTTTGAFFSLLQPASLGTSRSPRSSCRTAAGAGRLRSDIHQRSSPAGGF